MGSPALFQGSFVKLLKSALNLNDQAYILTGTADPTSSAQSAPQGSLYLRTGTSGSQLYVKLDSGSTTNWRDSSASAFRRVTQSAHGFTVGKWVGLNGSTYALAEVSSSSAAVQALGVVSAVIDSNNFVITGSGYVTGLSGLTAGSAYYISSAGAIVSTPATITSPTVTFQQQVFIADSTTSGFVAIGSALVTASSTRDGLMGIVAQSFEGTKTFLKKIVANVGVEVPNTVISSGTEVIPSGNTRLTGRLVVPVGATIQVDGDLQVTGAITGGGTLTGSGTITSI